MFVLFEVGSGGIVLLALLVVMWLHLRVLTGIAPYQTVLTHGFVLDEKGHKMSKSVGNVVDPMTVIEGGKNQKVGLLIILHIMLIGKLLPVIRPFISDTYFTSHLI